MRGERARGGEQQGVRVVRAGERVDGDDAVGAGLVLDHDRLAPALGEMVAEQPRRDVLRASGPEADDEAHRPLRPDLCLRFRLRLRGRRYEERGERGHRHARNGRIQF